MKLLPFAAGFLVVLYGCASPTPQAVAQQECPTPTERTDDVLSVSLARAKAADISGDPSGPTRALRDPGDTVTCAALAERYRPRVRGSEVAIAFYEAGDWFIVVEARPLPQTLDEVLSSGGAFLTVYERSLERSVSVAG